MMDLRSDVYILRHSLTYRSIIVTISLRYSHSILLSSGCLRVLVLILVLVLNIESLRLILYTSSPR